jgi:hypothetical protein
MKCTWQTETGTVNSPQICGKRAADGFLWCKEHIADARANYPQHEIPQTTVVIFRKWPKSEGGDVIALFPLEPATVGNPYHCESFQHVGQHGAADPNGLIQVTKPAKPEEYANLQRELESEPYRYNLEVRKRIPSNAVDVRRGKLAR